jgi:hypothetical protein
MRAIGNQGQLNDRKGWVVLWLLFVVERGGEGVVCVFWQ